MNKSKFEDVIAVQGRLIYTNVGDSMYPFIQPRDLLVIEAAQKPLKKYDIPLYKRDSGQYVLHRIIRVMGDEYFLCGDNRAYPERGIYDKHIIGVLTKIVRNGEELDVYSPKLKRYAFFRCKTIPLRRFISKVIKKAK